MENIILGKKLKELRKNKKLTQKQISNDLGYSASRYSNYENNIRMPSLDELVILADYFDVTTDYLLGRTDKKNIEIVQYDNLKVHQRKGTAPLTEEQIEFLNNLIDEKLGKK